MLQLVFYTFGFTLLASALMVVLLRNPVHSVLFLIFAFFNAAALFILLGAEFIAMTLVIVYVGAIAVLFLFVVMMLNIKVEEVKQGFIKHSILGSLLAVCVFVQMSIALVNSNEFLPTAARKLQMIQNNTQQIGLVLYTQHFIAFQMAGLVLLAAMVGAIVLTLVPSGGTTKTQDICAQIKRTRDESVQLVEVKSGEGVEI
jgi:NADH-quinone oxidoreductase subunit J